MTGAAKADQTRAGSHSHGSPLCQGIWAGVVVGWVVAGPGSDFSEVPAAGCQPAALEPVAAPVCPPGPAALVRASRTIWW